MKKLNQRAKVGLISVAIIVATGLGVAALNAPESTDATDSPLTQQVQRHDEQLDNHEARITNTEKDVQAVQQSTGTAPATERVIVKEVTTPKPSEPSSPAPTSESPSNPAPPPPITTPICMNNEGQTACQ